MLAADLVIHNGAGTLGNDWEGWGTFAQVLVFVLVTGLVIVGCTFGLLVRWGLKPSARGNRPAAAALVAGIASLASYAIFFTWAPPLIAPAALLLGREGLRVADRRPDERRGRTRAVTGLVLGIVSLTAFGCLLAYSLVTGHYPFGL